MHKSLWLISVLIFSIPHAHAGKPSTPSTQQLQPVTPGTPSPTTPEANPANTPQSSGTNVSATDNTNQQGGFLSTSAGQAAVVGGVAGVGAMAVGIYTVNKFRANSSTQPANILQMPELLAKKAAIDDYEKSIENLKKANMDSKASTQERNKKIATLLGEKSEPSPLVAPPPYQIKLLNQGELDTAIGNVQDNISNLKLNNTEYKAAFTMAQGKVMDELRKNELSPAAYQWLSVLHRNGDLENFAHRESLEQLLGHHEALKAEEADKKLTTGYTLGSNPLPLGLEKVEELSKQDFEKIHSDLRTSISKINHKEGSDTSQQRAFYGHTQHIKRTLDSMNHEVYDHELRQCLGYVWENMAQQSPGGEHIKKLLDHYTALAQKIAKPVEVKK